MKRLVSHMMAALLLAAAPGAALAQDKTFPPMPAHSVAQAERVLVPFLESVKGGAVAPAYAALFAGTPLESRTSEIQQLTAQTTLLTQILGDISGWELFDSECPISRLCLMKYAVHAESGPFFAWFYMYDRGDRWTITQVLVGNTPPFAF